jgi:hypothetical protein
VDQRISHERMALALPNAGAGARPSPGIRGFISSLIPAASLLSVRDRLEEAGLIRRLPDPNDRRGTLIEPTEAGHAAWERCTGAQAQREALIASALSEDEKEILHGLLRRLMRAFPPEYASMKKHHPDQED